MTMKGLLRLLGLALVSGAVLAGGVDRVADAQASIPAPQPVAGDQQAFEPDAAAACVEASSETESAFSEDLASLVEGAAAAAPACKACKGRTWCKCTYNGMPRSSCNPCCYTNNIGVTICLD